MLPLTHFLRIVRGILLKGAPLDALLGEVAATGVFSVAALARRDGDLPQAAR